MNQYFESMAMVELNNFGKIVESQRRVRILNTRIQEGMKEKSQTD